MDECRIIGVESKPVITIYYLNSDCRLNIKIATLIVFGLYAARLYAKVNGKVNVYISSLI